MGAQTHPPLPEADVLDVLAALYLRTPTADTLDAVATAPVLGPVDDRLEDVLSDYHELFFVPVSGRYVPPFESAQRDGSLGGPLVRQVAAAYDEAGFDVTSLVFDERWGRMPPPDHVGCELAFVAALQRSAASAPPEDVPALLDAARAFWRLHPAEWIGDFGHGVAANARTVLYRRAGLHGASLAGSGSGPRHPAGPVTSAR